MRRLLISVGLASAWGLGFLAGRLASESSELHFGAGRSEVLATFEGGSIAAASLRAEIAERGPQAALHAQDPKAARALLDEVVDRALLAREARKAGYDADPAVQLRQEQVLAAEYRRRNLDGPARALAVSDAEVRAAFEAQRPSLTTPERVRVAYLFLATPSGKATLDSADVARLLAAIKDERGLPDRLEGVSRGEHPYLGREELADRSGAPVADAAFALARAGDITPKPIQGKRGVYVLRLLGRTPGEDPRFEDHSDRIRSQLLEQRRLGLDARRLRELRRAAAVSVDEAALARFAQELEPAPPRP